VFAPDAAERLADRRMLGVERMAGDAAGARDGGVAGRCKAGIA
jgi:hypothetical protein